MGYTLTPYPDKAIVPDLHATWPVEPDPTFSVIRALNRFPALLWRNEKRTTCTLTVAVSDKQSFQVHEVTESGGEALCGVIDIAEAALINLTVGA